MADDARLNRWRLVLGAGSEQAMGEATGEAAAQMAALDYLYDREIGDGRNIATAHKGPGSLDASNLTVVDWLNHIHELFPKKTIERIEKDAIERYGLEEMFTDPEVLEKVEPNQALLKAILSTKHLMNEEVLKSARRIAQKVVRALLERLARPVRSPFLGTIDPRRRSPMKVAKNFDAKTTIARNLAHYNREERRLFIETPYFFSRVRRHVDRWQIIILVDQSGSMADSVIHASVIAAIFFGIRYLNTHLVAFDTSVVDLTEDVADPVEVLMKTQLGGGTDIGQALSYAHELVDDPKKAIVVLITDFCEGAPLPRLYGAARALLESGVKLLGLAALDEGAYPTYDSAIAGRLASMGAHVGAMTPNELAAWVADVVKP